MTLRARWAACLMLLGARAVAQDFHDDFNDLAGWNDLSTAITWGGNADPVSAFTNEGGTAYIRPEVQGFGGISTTNDVRAFTCLDRRFAETVYHQAAVITIDWRMRFTALDNSGEKGRFILALNHDYPEGGLDLSLNEKHNQVNQAWWARPAYNLRIRHATQNHNGPILMYGGGKDVDGEYETNTLGWLPGYISGAGGLSPGSGDNYPTNSWVKINGVFVSTNQRIYRAILRPDRWQLWIDTDDSGIIENNELKGEMLLPSATNAPQYRYFERIEGLRLYWATSSPTGFTAKLDWLTLSVEHLDTDGDGIEDRWEWRHFGGTNTLAGNVAADPDRDGLSNEGEYWAGTDPTNAASVLGWRVVAPGVGDELVLAWPSVTDRVYRVWSATNLEAGFDQVITAGMAATPPWNAVTTRHDAFPRWYRIELDRN